MRCLLLLFLCCLTVSLLYGQEPPPGILPQRTQQFPQPHKTSLTQGQEQTTQKPLHEPAVVERNFINVIAGRSAIIRHITTSPSGINGKPNEIIRATYGGNERICVGTGTGPGAMTIWLCVTLGAV